MAPAVGEDGTSDAAARLLIPILLLLVGKPLMAAIASPKANVNRRSAISATAAGVMAVGVAAIGGTAASNEPNSPKLWTLEGVLTVHPKFLYRYYLEILNGQKCALYGVDHERDKELAGIPLPGFVRVRGTLGTKEHTGGTPENRLHSRRAGSCTWTCMRPRY